MSEPCPVLSVVITFASDTIRPRGSVDCLVGCLEGFARQIDAPPTELIVPYDDAVEGIDALRRRFPEVDFLHVSGPRDPSRAGDRVHWDRLRTRGLQAASGSLLALVEDHSRPDARWCAAVAAAHRRDWAAVGGAIENGVDRPLNWAVYFCDFGRYQNPVPAGESPCASDANVSYKRAALESIRDVWEPEFREVVVHGALAARGEKIALSPDIVLYQHRRELRLGPCLRERFVWGRAYGVIRCSLVSSRKRLAYALLSPLLPALLTGRGLVTAWRRRRCFDRFLRALPLIVTLQTAWSLGELAGYLRGGGRSA